MDTTLRTDAKHASPEVQYQLRKSIVRLSRTGKTGKEIAKLLDVSEGHVSGVLKAYKTGGNAAIALKKRGRRKGDKRILTPEQEREIRSIIIEKHPEQMKFKECMWTRNNIRDLIREKYKMEIPLSTLGYYLERWGFSVQAPMLCAVVYAPNGGNIKLRPKREKGSLYWEVACDTTVSVERTKGGWALITAICTDGATRRAWMMEDFLKYISG